MAYRRSPVDNQPRPSGGRVDTPERRKREAARLLEAQRAGRDSVIANMMRLRALRLAKEAETRETGAGVAGTVAAPVKRRAKKSVS